MKNVWKFKGLDCRQIKEEILSKDWSIVDLPFNMRLENTACVDYNKLPLDILNDDDKVIIIDKLSLFMQTMTDLNDDFLKQLTIICNVNIKCSNQIADIILVRYNKVFVIQFAYDFISVTNHQELKENKVIYVLQQIEQTLKRNLPIDSVVRTFLFNIKNDKENILTANRLKGEIKEFFGRTTMKELLRLIA